MQSTPYYKKYINVFLGIGANLGDRKAALRTAQELIEKYVGKIAKRSSTYETQPWGKPEQPAFLNMVVMANTTMDPRELLDSIAKMEKELGRERVEKWGPRAIDIDILFYGHRIIRDKGLEIPHPEFHKRAFVLVPMMEIDPDFEHPVLKQPIDALYLDCMDDSEVVQLGG